MCVKPKKSLKLGVCMNYVHEDCSKRKVLAWETPMSWWWCLESSNLLIFVVSRVKWWRPGWLGIWTLSCCILGQFQPSRSSKYLYIGRTEMNQLLHWKLWQRFSHIWGHMDEANWLTCTAFWSAWLSRFDDFHACVLTILWVVYATHRHVHQMDSRLKLTEHHSHTGNEVHVCIPYMYECR